MTDDFDYQGFLERHRAAVLKEYRSPDVEAFERRFGKIPPSLLRLYNLRETLIRRGVNAETDEGGIYIESFISLSPRSVESCEMYGWRFFAFACGGEAQSYLISIEEPTRTFIDYEGDGADIEELPVNFEKLVTDLLKRLSS